MAHPPRRVAPLTLNTSHQARRNAAQLLLILLASTKACPSAALRVGGAMPENAGAMMDKAVFRGPFRRRL